MLISVGEIAHFFTLAGLAPWATTWLCGKGKQSLRFKSIYHFTMGNDLSLLTKYLPIRDCMALHVKDL
ncbi:MAG TPA: hypothetical protein DDE71_05945 [Tenacibaculum sp.]|nr:hypothetical protein [Tenacibaculum sp.]